MLFVKYRKSYLLIFTMLTILLTSILTPLYASAETHGYFHIPDGAVPLNEAVTVTVEFTSTESIGTASAAVTYNESYLTFESSDYASGGSGIINISAFPTDNTNDLIITLNFTPVQEGVSQLNLTNGTVTSPDGVTLSSSITAYAYITVGPASSSGSDSSSYTDSASDGSSYSDSSSADASSESSSADTSGLSAVLKSLTVESGELKPDFSPGIYDYTVTVSHDVDVFELEGETANESDTIWYSGAKYLVDGKNQRTITVTSADGLTSNVYTITIYREYEDENISESEASDEAAIESSSQTQSSEADSSSSSLTDESETTGMEDLRDSLMPALYIAMAVILVAVIILIVWIKSKTKDGMK
ncbi:MAG: cadherin-like beta sandwich domain-containing protein [Ruminococcus sp.]|nr:cadherin-like beta sandwich domain-containing protein [Ruminococcus sp.]